MVRRILITGANKGIGLAIAKRCVADHDDVEVILACRSKARGDAAAASLASPRVSVVELDSTSDASVVAAAAEVAKRHGDAPLYGVVNNAGIAAGTVAEILETNVRGPIRVDAAFLPLLADGGRIVEISSGAAPTCVVNAPPERQKFFTDPTRAGIESLVEEAVAAPDLAALGLGASRGGYGLSKALLNCHTICLAREHPALGINACTPGLVNTDLLVTAAPWFLPSFLVPILATRAMKAKTPDEGTRAPLALLFDDLEGNGRFYGSDAKRSPLDTPRDPEKDAPYVE